jgi:hypothetical protein
MTLSNAMQVVLLRVYIKNETIISKSMKSTSVSASALTLPRSYNYSYNGKCSKDIDVCFIITCASYAITITEYFDKGTNFILMLLS